MTVTDPLPLDGPALTHLAHTLGLSPKGAVAWRGGITLTAWLPGATWTAVTIPWWEPDTHLEQAQAILHQLEAQGWTTSRGWDAPAQHGVYEVWRGDLQARGDWGEPYRVHDAVTRETDPSEALACLRCCVLARMQWTEKEGA